jgi:phage gp46-like protein
MGQAPLALALVDGRPEMQMDYRSDGRSDVLLSLLVRRGSAWAMPTFGSRLHELAKLHAGVEDLAAKHCQDALRWLVDTGEAKAVDAEAERDTGTRDRLNLRAGVTWADGTPANYEVYQEVV